MKTKIVEKVSDRLNRIVKEGARNQGFHVTCENINIYTDGEVTFDAVSPEFYRTDFKERKELIENVLNEAVRNKTLSKKERSQISLIFTYTLSEWEVIQSDRESDIE